MIRRRPIAILFAIAACTLAGCVPGDHRGSGDAAMRAKLQIISSINMVAIPGGRFLMGTAAPDGQQGYPQHAVAINPFRIAETDVTFDQYDAFVRATSLPRPQDEGFGRGDRPVINVSWTEMNSFIAWLNAGTGHRFRLPSEAEWEYAARAGTTTAYYWGDTVTPHLANAGDPRFQGTSPVRAFKANAFGLYDMAGNVWQAVEDCRHATYDGAPDNGSSWVDAPCDSRIARGGFYGSITRGIRVTARSAVGETFRSMGLGFRVAE